MEKGHRSGSPPPGSHWVLRKLPEAAAGDGEIDGAGENKRTKAMARDCAVVTEAGAGAKAKDAAAASDRKMVDEAGAGDEAKAAAASSGCKMVAEAGAGGEAAEARKIKTKVVKMGKDDACIRELLEWRKKPRRPPFVIPDGITCPTTRAALAEGAAALKALREDNEALLEQYDRLGYAYVEVFDEEVELDPLMAFLHDYAAGKICRA